MTNTKPITNHETDQSPAAALWRIAVSNYEAAKAAMDAANDAYNRAEEAYHAEARHIDSYCEAYHFGSKLTREVARENALLAIILRDHRGKTKLTQEERAAVNAEADRAVVEFYAALAWNEKLEAKHRLGELDEALSLAGAATCEAELKLIDTPAPDGAAALVKLALITDDYRGPDPEDQHSFDQLASDLRRLFGSK